MQAGGVCHSKRVEVICDALYSTFEDETCYKRDWGEDLMGVALFVDTLLEDLEVQILSRGDYDVAPGDLKHLFWELLESCKGEG